MVRGDGRIFKYKNSRFWWLGYFHKGKEIRESTKTTDERAARNKLRLRLKQIGAAQIGARPFIGPSVEKLTFEHMAASYEQSRNQKRATTRWASACLAHLRRHFGDTRAIDIDAMAVSAYKDARLQAGAAAGTINRELAVLRRLFTLAVRYKKLYDPPYIEMLDEPKPRQGFFEKAEYLAIRTYLPATLQDVLDFAYLSGWRKGEVLSLEWSDVDRAGGVIRLRPEVSKNDEGRTLALSAPLRAVIERRLTAREYRTPNGTAELSPFVFHVRGKAIGDFRKAWAKACIAAGFFRVVGKDAKGNPIKAPSKLFHDLRRTVVRDLVRAGVPERVAMAHTGHKTRSVFDRYNIVDDRDLRMASARLAEHRTAMESAPTVVPLVQRRTRRESR